MRRIVLVIGMAAVLAWGAALAAGCSEDSCANACGTDCCADGQTCSDGQCVAPCTEECSMAGLFGCASPPNEGLVVCADFDGDPCLEWGGLHECDPGEQCVDGDCVSDCVDECPSSGQLMCEADGYRTCGEHDADPCLEWSELTGCPPGETCSNGSCSNSCTNECDDDGNTSCEGTGVKTCGQYDTDSCLDWSPVEACEDDESCEGGQCAPLECTEEGEDCVCGDDECCEGHCCPVLFICVSFPPDEDFCF